MYLTKLSPTLCLVSVALIFGQIPPSKTEAPNLKVYHTPESLPSFSDKPEKQVRLSAYSSQVVAFGPVFVEIEAIDTTNCSECKFTDLSTGDLKLVIENGNNERRFYRPVFQACWFGQVQPIVLKSHETVIISAGEIVTRDPGRIRLFVVDGHNRIVSNRVEVRVEAPASKEDVHWVEEARKQASEYGLFVYFGGGDHLANGRRIVEGMSIHSGRNATWARAILACNHALSARDMKQMKIVRKADVDLALSELPQEGVPPGLLHQLAKNIRIAAYNGDDPGHASDKALRIIETRLQAE
jgi:hypothetical protein